MKKKLAFLSFALLILTLVFAFTACGGSGSGGGDEPGKEECKHSWQETIDSEATCTDKGGKTLSCSLCGEVRKEGIDPLGHNLVTVSAKAPTCTETGLTEGKFCNRCNKAIVKQDAVAALGHTLVTDAAVAATCTTDGLTAGAHCSVCETVTTPQTTVTALGHDLITVTGFAPTCTEAGLSDGTKCSRCPHVEVEQGTIEATGHTEVEDLGYAATCTTAGLTNGKHCSVCTTVTVEQVPIEATGHKIVTSGAVAPTCKSEGESGGKACETCSVVFETSNTLAVVDHKFEGGSCVFCQLTVSAGLAYADVDAGSCEVTGIGTFQGTELVIPDKHENKDVVGIADGAFEGKTGITKVTVTGKLEYIGEDAFKDCTALKTVTLPKSVTEVKSGAFDGASSLEAINCEDFNQTNTWASDYLGSASAKLVAAKNNGLTPFEIYKLAMQHINANLDKYVADDHRVLSLDEIASEVFEKAKDDYRKELQAQGGLSPDEIEQMVEQMYQQSFAAYTQLKAMLDIVMDTRTEYTGDSFYIRNYTRYGYDGDETTNQYWYYDGCFFAIEPKANPQRLVYRMGILALNDLLKRSTSGSAQELFTEKFFKAAEFSRNGSGYLLTVDVVGDALTEYLLMMSNDSMKDAFESMGFAYDDVTYYYYFDSNGKIERVSVDAGFSMGASESSSGFTGSVVITQTFSNVGTLTELVTKPYGNGFSSSEVPSVPSCNHPYQKTIKGFAATCTEAGLTDGKYCTRCYADLQLPELIPAGHKLENGVCTECKLDTTLSVGLAYEYNADGKTATLIGLGSCRDENIVIPTDVHGVVITKIAKDAFNGASFVKSVKIPASVGVIENGAFDGAIALEKAYVPAILVKYLPKTVKEIAITDGETIFAGSFENFKALTTLTLGSSVKTIEDGAFVGCDRLFIIYNYSNVYLSAGSDEDGGVAKYAMSIVTNKNQVSNVSVVGDFVFVRTNNYNSEKYFLRKYIGESENVILPEFVNGNTYTVDDNAFKGVSTIKTIDVPASITNVNEYAFDGCESSIIAVRASGDFIRRVPTASLQYVEVISGTMGERFLQEAPELVEAKVNIDYLSSYAFYACPKLEKVTIGEDVTSVYPYSFAKCESLKKLYIESESLRFEYNTLGEVSGVSLYVENSAILCGINAGNLWNAVDNLYVNGTFTRNVTVPAGVKAVANNAFSSCKAIDTITFSEGLESVGNHAFSNSSIKAVNFASGLKQIGASAFINAKELENVNLPNGLTTIGSSAFSGAISLKSITIPASVSAIPDYCFDGALSLKSVTVNSSVNGGTVSGAKSIGKRAFYRCESLESVNLGSSVKSIGDKAFELCAIESLDLSSVETIGKSAFRGNNIRALVLSENLKSVASSAFYSNELVSITLPASLETLGENAFGGSRVAEIVNNSTINITASNASSYFSSGTSTLYSITTGESEIVYDENGFGFLTLTDGNAGGVPAGVYLVDYKGSDKYLTLPDSFESNNYAIGSSAFVNSTVAYVAVSDGVTKIYPYAFAYAYNLAGIKLGANVSAVEEKAFMGLTTMIEIIVPEGSNLSNLPTVPEKHSGETKLYCTSDGFVFWEKENGDVYLVAYAGNEEKIVLPEYFGTKAYHVYEKAFYHCGIKEISVPDTLLSVGKDFVNKLTVKTTLYNGVCYLGNSENPYVIALGLDATPYTDSYGGQSVKSVTFHDGTVMIAPYFNMGYYFDKNNNDYWKIPFKSIENIDFGESLRYIGAYAFAECRQLQAIILPDTVEVIEENAFTNCESVAELYLSSSLKYIGNQAFYYLYYLEELTIPENVSYIGDNAFGLTHSLVKLNFNAKALVSFGNNVFYNTSSSGAKKDVSVVVGDGVTIIPNYAFGAASHALKVTSVTVTDPSDLKYIGAYAFGNNCTWENLDLPNVEYVGERAFFGATSLKSVKLLNAAYIGKYAFSACTNLESVEIEDAVIDEYAFDGCTKLVNVKIGDANIGQRAFRNCTALETAEIGVNAVLNYSIFEGCEAVKSLTLSLEEKTLNSLFGGDTNSVPASLTSVTLLGDKVVYAALSGMQYVTTLEIADTVTEIGSYAFYEMSGITEVTLPEGLKKIGQYAFAKCTNLKSLTIPSGVEEIGLYVVEGATKLESLEMPFVGNTVDNPAPLKNFASVNNNRKAIISTLNTLKITNASKLCDGMLNADTSGYYNQNATNSIQTVIIEGSVTVIPKNCFNGSTSLVTVSLPLGIVEISENAFKGCAALKNINVPTGVEKIGNNAFAGCTALETLELPETLKEIGDSALYNLTSIKKLTIPESVTTLGAGAIGFDNFDAVDKNVFIEYEGAYYLGNEANHYMILVKATSTAIESCKIADTARFILNSAFWNCTKLKSITFPASVEHIGTSAFHNTGLTEVTIPGTVKSIGNYVFDSCGSITTVTICEGIKIIPANAFADCRKIKTLNLPVGLEKIESYAFNNTSITTINIPTLEDWLAIENNASGLFSTGSIDVIAGLYIGGKLLTDLVIPEGITEIKSGAFRNYQLLNTVTLGNDVEKVGSSAFAGCKINVITIGEKLNYIGGSAFGSAYGAVFIPETVVTVCEDAFAYFCGQIFVEYASTALPETWHKDWAYKPSIPVTYNADGVYTDENGVIYGLLGDGSATILAYVGTDSDVVIPDKVSGNYKVTKIGLNVFNGSSLITSFTAGANLTTIPNNAFQRALNLKTVDLSACVNMTEIGDYAFEGCAALEEVKLPVGRLDRVGKQAFYNCTKLATINIEAICADIGEEAFYNCASLTEVTLIVHTIGDRAFYSCDSLLTLDLGLSIKTISNQAFAHCAIQNLVIPDQVTTIESQAFFRCNFVSITIGSGVNKIDVKAFGDILNGLTSVTFKNVSGWYVNNNTSVSPSETDFAANAALLKTHCGKNWNRYG